MLYVMIVNAAAMTVFALVAVTCAWGLARLMDKANDLEKGWLCSGGFKRVVETIETEPVAAAVYYGARWVGICIMMGWLFSKPV